MYEVTEHDDGYVIEYDELDIDRDDAVELLERNGFGYRDPGPEFTSLRMTDETLDEGYRTETVTEVYLTDEDAEVHIRNGDPPDEEWVYQGLERVLEGEEAPIDVQGLFAEDDPLADLPYDFSYTDRDEDWWKNEGVIWTGSARLS